MEAMLVLMTKLQELGYTEVTEFYKATLTSPDGNTIISIAASGGVHNVAVFCRTNDSTKTYDFLNIRSKDDGESVLSTLGLNS